MIYDTFIFFNELDLLEIRLNILENAVDKFVLVEATKTFQLDAKPLYFEENKDRFAKWADKIIHVILPIDLNVEESVRLGVHRHKVEHDIRKAIGLGLQTAQPDDIVIVSDVDEMYDKSHLDKAISALNKHKFCEFHQRFFYYYLNSLNVQNGAMANWRGPVACKFKDFTDAQAVRNVRGRAGNAVNIDAGWHFSYTGGIDKIYAKLNSGAHPELDEAIKDRAVVQKRIEAGTDLFGRQNKPHQVCIQIDNTFPKYIQENTEKYAHLIKKVK